MAVTSIELDTPRQLELKFEEPLKSVASEKEGETNSFQKFVHFNENSEYRKATKKWHIGKEVFENKNDATRIVIKANKITFDNTEQNFKSALDIAQDKGWKAIRIKGIDNSSKSELWFQAQMRGFETKGYKPTKADLQRLEGAKERQKSEGLDIKPKTTAAMAAESEKNEDQGLSNQELFMRDMKEIIVEAGRSMDLDDKQINILENSVMEQIALAKSNGKTVNAKKLSEKSRAIQQNLPLVRESFEKSVNMEQKLVKKRNEQGKNKQKNLQAHQKDSVNKPNNKAITQPEITR